MEHKKKILVGYDGSDYADAAIIDLLRSGLPSAASAVLIAMPETASDMAPVARQGSDLLRSHFPHWELSVDLGIGSAASVVAKKAARWHPDLIILGLSPNSGNESGFGAVSWRIASQASCSVRMARGFRPLADEAPRILLCVDGASHSTAAAEAVASREWPKGTEVRVFTVVNPFDYSIPDLLDRAVQRAKAFHKVIASEVNCTPAFTSSVVREGEPEKVILHEAETWHADTIFLAPRDSYRFNRLTGAGVCAAVMAKARCAVELARVARDSAEAASFPAAPAASPVFRLR